MTKEELTSQLLDLGFKHDVYSEYHNEAFEHKKYIFGRKRLSLEMFVDYYNLRIVWHYGEGKKISKNYYMSKEVSSYKSAKTLINDFVSYCGKMYGIK